MNLIRIKDQLFNTEEIIDIKKATGSKNLKGKVFLIVTTTENVIHGSGMFTIGYENKKHFIEMSERQADNELTRLEGKRG